MGITSALSPSKSWRSASVARVQAQDRRFRVRMAVHSANIDFTRELRTVFDARGMLQTASICPSDLFSNFPHLGLAPED